MAGGIGKIGALYQLGNKGDELAFTLEKAEFASRVLFKDTAKFPGEGQRLVVLTNC